MRIKDAARADRRDIAAYRRRHETVDAWFERKFRTLEATLTGRPVDWAEIADALNWQGVRLADGGRLDGAACFQAYARVAAARGYPAPAWAQRRGHAR